MRTSMKLLTMSAVALSLIATSLTDKARAAEKLNVLIVTGWDVKSHQWQESTELIKNILEKSGRFDVTVSSDKGVFGSPKLNEFDAVVLGYGYWKEPDPSAEQKAGLLNYAKQGGGIVALHFACSSFQEWDDYATMLGRVWKKGVGGHGPYGDFLVNIKKADHPITRGLDDFQTQDELYAKLSGDEEIEVLASAYSDWSKKVEPIVFVKPYGKGRVVQNVLGHGLDSKQNPSYQRLLVRGVEWAATGKVTLD